jgi:predicted anti-sigma-YlaC factor YlaD
MIAGEKNQCALAKEYYYDMLDPDTVDQVPENIQDHIANCLHCVRRLAQLHQLLSDLAHRNQKEPTTIRQIPTQLARHFPLHKAQVDCAMVKKFLPLLVDPGSGIKIPTIVTVHLDQCPQCNQDFETLRSLNIYQFPPFE